MAAPTKAEAFLTMLRNSTLVEADQLDSFLERAGAVLLAAAPAAIAKSLVKEGLITPFHAQQLLQGRWRGFSLGKYRVLQPIGAGGMGQVFLCQHSVMRRLVAVKVLPAKHTQDPTALLRLQREARAAAALDHTNCVRAYDIDQDEKRHFLVLEYVDGVNLEHVLNRHGPLSIDLALDYAAQAACGLQHAHLNGIIHRDVKPSNLLLDRSGIVKVLDLGLSRLFRDTGDNITTNFDANQVLGTADYLAPEQAASSHGVDGRADVYSLGCTLYALLTGQPPFHDSPTVAQKLIHQQVRDPVPVRQLRAEVPEGVEAVLQRMLAKAPEERLQNFGEVLEALAPWRPAHVPAPLQEWMPELCPAVRNLLQVRTGPDTPRPGTPLSGVALAASPAASLSPLPRSTPSASQPKVASGPGDDGGKAAGRTGGRWLLGVGVVALFGAVGIGLAMLWSGWLSPAASPAPAPAHVPLPPGTLAPDQAAQHRGEIRTVQFPVRSTGSAVRSAAIFLNSQADYRRRDNFCAMIAASVVEEEKKAGREDLLQRFKDKTIRVTGKITLYEDRPQIVVIDINSIELVSD